MKDKHLEIKILFVLGYCLTFFVVINGTVLVNQWFNQSIKKQEADSYRSNVTISITDESQFAMGETIDGEVLDEEIEERQEIAKKIINLFANQEFTTYMKTGFRLKNGEVTDTAYLILSYKEEWFQRLLNGRYPTKNEIDNGKKVCLVGKHTLPLTYERNNKRYIDLDNMRYEVIGVLEDIEDNPDGSLVCLFYSQKNNEDFISIEERIAEAFVLGDYFSFCVGSNLEAVDDAALELIDEIKNTYGLLVDIGEYVRISRNITNYYMKIKRNILLFMFIISLLNCLKITSLWVQSKKKDIVIMRAFGMGARQILQQLFKQIVALSVWIFVISSVLCCGVIITQHKGDVLWSCIMQLLFMFLVYGLILLTTMIPAFIYTKRIQPAVGLREL